MDGYLGEIRTWVEDGLITLLGELEGTPEVLVSAMSHATLGGGKRLRPAVCALVAEELGAQRDAALPPAMAIELIHGYSLVHDDLPCMDDDALRRGQPTCHMVYGEATAVLAGDALLTLAFEVLSRPGSPELVGILARGAGGSGMVGGQVLDLESEGTPPEAGAVREIHARKTAALFEAAAEMGAVIAGADGEARRAARAYGRSLGLCFQAVDDVLDVTGDAASLGKTPGKDAALERPSLVRRLGLEGAQLEAARHADDALSAAEELNWGPDSRPAALVQRLLARTR